MKKLIKIDTEKLFIDITDKVSKLAKDWGKSGIVNIFPILLRFVYGVAKMNLHKADVRFFLDKLRQSGSNRKEISKILNICMT